MRKTADLLKYYRLEPGKLLEVCPALWHTVF